jgi:beta-lactamase regulating signal transducer with metallopeptidase domain
MIRKLLATATLAVLGLLWLPAMASAAAPAYPAPPVTPETAIPAAVDAVTAPEIASQTTDVGSLASTGAGFNVGLTVWIAVAVLVVGVGLMLAGRRSRKSGAKG